MRDNASDQERFYIEIEQTCSACNFDGAQDECEVCGGDVHYTERHQIPPETVAAIRASSRSEEVRDA